MIINEQYELLQKDSHPYLGYPEVLVARDGRVFMLSVSASRLSVALLHGESEINMQNLVTVKFAKLEHP